MIQDSESATRYYESRFVHDARRRSVWKVICRYLQKDIGTHARILDLGAGYCDFINNIEASEKHALDIYPAFVQYADADVVTHVGNCEDLSDFDTAYFDVVFESNVFEHLERTSLSRTLAEIHRVLKPAGRFIAVQPNFRLCYKTYFDDYTHLQVFTDVSLADLIESSGFEVKRSEARFLPTSFKSRLPAWPWLTSIYLLSSFRPFAGQMLIVSQSVKTF